MRQAAPPLSTCGMEASVADRTGLSFAGSRGRLLRSVLTSAVRTDRRAPSPGPEGVHDDLEAFGQLCDALTVQESFFFREPSKLALLRHHAFPELRASNRTVRVWSAGCATGEEAFTLAMLLNDAGFAHRYRVLGSDLSPAAVSAAQEATYGRWSMRGLSEQTLSQYFVTDSDRYRVADAFRDNVTFQQHNLLEPLPARVGPFDLILCRNVLIYFTAEAIQRAAASLVEALAPGGWLLLGVSDPLLDGVAGLETVNTPHGVVYRRGVQASEPVSAPPSPAPRTTPARREPAASRPAGSRPTPPASRATPDLDLPGLVAAGVRALELGKPRQAAEQARRALGSSPHHRAAHQLLVEALAADGRLADAAAAAGRAVSELPGDVELRNLQAVVLLEQGHADQAVAVARQAVYLDPGFALAHLVLARAQEILGDDAAARRARRNAQKLMARQD